MKRSFETDLVINLWPPNTLSTRTYNVRKNIMQVYYLVKVHLKKLFTTCIILCVKVKNRYIIYDWSIDNLFALSVKTS